MDLEWARSLLRQCKAASTAAFVKQLGSVWVREENQRLYENRGPGNGWCKVDDPKGGDPLWWPNDLRVREYPEVRSPDARGVALPEVGR